MSYGVQDQNENAKVKVDKVKASTYAEIGQMQTDFIITEPGPGRALGRRIRHLVSAALVSGSAAAMAFGPATTAHADAQTCIEASGGLMCNAVYGSGTYVGAMRSHYQSWNPAQRLCNTSAWFFYVPPTGGAYGLDYQKRAGCTQKAAWFDARVDRTFANNTLLCSKFYVDDTFKGEKCVGVPG